jgi:hypothetical protein
MDSNAGEIAEDGFKRARPKKKSMRTWAVYDQKDYRSR